MECTIDETGVSQCLCANCQYNWQEFLASPKPLSRTTARCGFDPDCECDNCTWGRVATEGFTLEELLGDNDGLLRIIVRSAGYSGRVVGFELVNGICWVWDYPRGHWDEVPSFTVPASPTGMAQIEEYFAYCL